MYIVAALIVAGAIVWASFAIAREVGAARQAAERRRTLQLLDLFSGALAAADADPRALLVWEPVVRAARRLFPDECAALDRAAGATFPFGRDRVQAAHARWTAEWLAWERTHDADYKLKAAAAEEELAASKGSTGSATARARVDAVEREKLERYQRRYEDYIRTAKALQALEQNLEGS
jgi:hypothetical protein